VEVKTRHGVANQGRQKHQIGVLNEQRVGVLKLGAERALQQSGPQLALHADCWVPGRSVPALQQRLTHQAERRRASTQPLLDGSGCRDYLLLGG
jgi:hypothetical protein